MSMVKKLCYVSVLLIIVVSIGFSSAEAIAGEANPAPFVFRNGVTFGMTKAEVIACEGREPDTHQDNSLCYQNELAGGMKADIYYGFEFGLRTIQSLFVETNDDYYTNSDCFDAIDRALVTKEPLIKSISNRFKPT